MSDEDQESKTEQPTDKRLGDARKEGDVPQSQEVRTWFAMLGMAAIVGMMAGPVCSKLLHMLPRYLETMGTRTLDVESLRALLAEIILDTALVLVMPMALLVVLGVLSSYLQFGWLFIPKKIKPDFTKLDLISGIKRMFSGRNLIEFVKGLIKLGLVGAVLFMVLWPHRQEISLLTNLEVPAILDYLHGLVMRVIVAVLLMVTLIAAGDFAYQKFAFNKKMRMSKQEVRDEHKQQEGDPMIKGRLRSLRMQRARQRMMQAVPTADVVVTNPTHFAVALKYDQETMSAPHVVAKGADLVAKRIRDLATENDVPIVENPPLARALFATVELDQEIPSEHYKAVAEVISYVMRLKGSVRR